MTAEALRPVPPPKKPPSTARGVVAVLAGWGIALVLGALFWLPLVVTEQLLAGSVAAESGKSAEAAKSVEALLGRRYEGYPRLALASGALQAIVALVLTLRLWRTRRAAAISLGVFALPTLFVAWLLWALTHISWC